MCVHECVCACVSVFTPSTLCTCETEAGAHDNNLAKLSFFHQFERYISGNGVFANIFQCKHDSQHMIPAKIHLQQKGEDNNTMDVKRIE